MAQLSKQELLEEAKKQSEMLERISRWRTYSLVLSAIGVAVAYMGFKAWRFLYFVISVFAPAERMSREYSGQQRTASDLTGCLVGGI